MHNKAGELSSNVSKHATVRSYYTLHANPSGKGVDVKLKQGLKIHWNPEMQVKHVKALVSNQQGSIEKVIIRTGKKILSSEAFLGFGALHHLEIIHTSPNKTPPSTTSDFYRSLFKDLTANFDFRLKSLS